MIKDDTQMDTLLAFLVPAIQTIDGQKGSAIFYYEASIFYEIERREKKINKRIIK